MLRKNRHVIFVIFAMRIQIEDKNITYERKSKTSNKNDYFRQNIKIFLFFL